MRSVFLWFSVVAFFYAFVQTPCLAATAPPVPKPEQFVLDLTGLLPQEDIQKMASLQRQALHDRQVLILVLTIPGMAEYEAENLSMEDYGRFVFQIWSKSGRLWRTDAFHKRGILLLVSLEERQVRIQLGSEWGNRWNRTCRSIMNDEIIPAFKAGNFGGGLKKGVEGLVHLAGKNPRSRPKMRLFGPVGDWADKNLDGLAIFSPFQPSIVVLLIIAGVAVIGFAFRLQGDKRDIVKLLGLNIVLLGVLTYLCVLTVILLLLMIHSAWRVQHGFGRAGYYGGGFGGFGGGGGAGGGASGGF